MYRHITVLQEEATEGLNIKKDGIYVDCTLGGGGHSYVIASQLNEKGKLISLDQDDSALKHAIALLDQFKERVVPIKSNFRYLQDVLHHANVPQKNGMPQVDGILYDLGVSSPQLDEADRGFGYQHDVELDMRMDPQGQLTAKEILNEWSEAELVRIFYQYGEEKFSKRIARAIVNKRKTARIETTTQLVELVKEGIPAPARRTGGHPAKRTFQALRIAVNDELAALEQSLHQAIRCLAPGGRLCVITFHSLEDRICKHIFNRYLTQCVCPVGFPICVCNYKGLLRLVNRKPIVPLPTELLQNPRARSAKLRVAQKL